MPPAIYLLSCMVASLNLGVRYLIPAYPFLFILAAAIVVRLGPVLIGRAARPIVGLILIGLAVESLVAYPHYLAFFNVLAGGPSAGDRYLVDSNLDWGQDAIRLNSYLRSRSESRACVAYFGTADLSYYGITVEPLPVTWDIHGREAANCLAAVSTTVLHDVGVAKGSYSWLRDLRPIDRVGYSIYIYDLRRTATTFR